MRSLITRVLLVAAMAAVPLCAVIPEASAASSVVYVSPGGSSTQPDTSCRAAGFNSLQLAVNAVALHGTVYVCPGTFHQNVTVPKSLSLIGAHGAIIDAAGQPYGVGLAADFVTVTGLTVENAKGTNSDPSDGIITAGFVAGKPIAGNHETIVGNLLVGNAGAGVDLNSTTGSTALRNISIKNGIGINVSDDLGKPASHNLIFNNYASANPGGCGIVLAEHTGAGIFSNWVNGNTANANGLGTPSAPNASSGSGIILAGGSPKGGVYNNAITRNFFIGNGHGGVALHAHVPKMNFSGNRILWNWIGTNNLRTDFKDLKTTGIYLADASPLTITVAGNFIYTNYYGVFTAGPVTATGVGFNVFRQVTTPLGSTPAYGG